MPSANRFSPVERKPSMFLDSSWQERRALAMLASVLMSVGAGRVRAAEPPSGGPRRPEQTTSSTAAPAPPSDERSAPSNAAATPSGRFEFGSYGRVNVASDLRGRTGRD